MRPIAFLIAAVLGATAWAQQSPAPDPHAVVREALADKASLPAAVPELPSKAQEIDPAAEQAAAAHRAAEAAAHRAPSIAEQARALAKDAAARASVSGGAVAPSDVDAQTAAAQARTLTTKPKAPGTPNGPTPPNERPPRP